MSRHYKTVALKVGRGVTLEFGEQKNVDEKYFSMGPNGSDIMLRGAGKVFGFDTWEQLVSALNPEKATYFCDDNKAPTRRNDDE